MRFYPIRLVSSQPKKPQGPVTLLEVTHLACSRSLSRSQVGLRGPRALGHVFGRRLAVERYGARSWGYCTQPPHLRSHGRQARPPSRGCTVHAQGVKSWGGSFFGILEPKISRFAARLMLEAPRYEKKQPRNAPPEPSSADLATSLSSCLIQSSVGWFY